MSVWAFLFTDLEGSTRRWEDAPEAMRVDLERHHELLGRAITDHGGRVLSDMGDGVAAVFSSPPDAMSAAIVAQQSFGSESWVGVDPLRARMALHVGEAFEHGAELRGPTLNRCARLMGAGHGGQLLCTGAMADLVADVIPGAIGIRDLGEHRLRDLARPEHVFQVLAPGLQDQFPALRTLESFRTNLPWQLSSFVGRDGELSEIGTLLDEHRLVTLVGPGGIGKTRLATQAAADRLPMYRDGVWLIDLTVLSDADGLIGLVAGTFSITANSGRDVEQALLDFLRRQQMLIVVDNCEHLLGGAAAFVEALQRSAPEVQVLATSREALGMAGERVFRPPPLEAPEVGVDEKAAASRPAFELFVDRARESRAEFAISDRATVEAVGEVCRRLDGMPLAIELAAARVSSMTPREIAANLDERFRLLSGQRGVGADRHRTLRAVIDWSYEALDPSQQNAMDALSVFTGPFRIDAVAAISRCDDVAALNLVGALVDKSMVVADPIGESTEYRLLETIRQYGSERLVELGLDNGVRARHLGFYVDFARDVDERIGFAGDGPLRERLDRELPNIRGAVDGAIESGNVDTAVQITAGLCWLEASPRAKNEVAALAVAVSGTAGFEAAPGAAIVLAQAVDEFWSRADTQAMAELAGRVDLVEAMSPRDRLSIALATKRAKYSGQSRADTEYTQLIVAAASEIDDDRLVAIAHTKEAINAVLHDRRDDALHHAEIAVTAARRADSSSGARLAYALLALGLALDAQQHHDEAFAAFEEAVAVTDVGEIWSATEALAGHHIKRSQIAEAARLYGAVLDHHRSLGHLGRASDLCAQVAELLVTLERDREAIEVYSVLASQKPPLFDVDSPFFAANLDRARQRLPNDELEAAAAAGAAITLDDLVDTLIDRLAELAGSEPYG